MVREARQVHFVLVPWETVHWTERVFNVALDSASCQLVPISIKGKIDSDDVKYGSLMLQEEGLHICVDFEMSSRLGSSQNHSLFCM